MRDLVNWQDHVVEYPGRFSITEDSDGYSTLEKAPGTVKQQGTAQNAANFNAMDLAAFEAMLMANENARVIMKLGDALDGVVGEKLTVTLTNSYEYPFNNSKQTVQLSTSRNNTDYTVDVEVESVTGGFAGDFTISDKLVNGFKIAYSGSATEVVANCYVRGGI